MGNNIINTPMFISICNKLGFNPLTEKNPNIKLDKSLVIDDNPSIWEKLSIEEMLLLAPYMTSQKYTAAE